MKKLLILLLLISVIVVSGCVEQDTLVVSGVKDGVVIKDFSFDTSKIYVGDSIGLNLYIQNIGDVPAFLKNVTIFGVVTTGGSDPGDYDWGEGTLRGFDLDGSELGNEDERTLAPSNPEIEFEGGSKHFRWRPRAPTNLQASTNYDFGARVEYEYETKYTGIIRIVNEDYLETLPIEERKTLIDAGGVISSSTSGGPLSLAVATGRHFITNGGGKKEIKFKLKNEGSGYPYYGDTLDSSSMYRVHIDSYQGLDNIECTSLDGEDVIKLSKGKERFFNCTFTTSSAIYKVDKTIAIKFGYKYYVDGSTSITVNP